MKWSRGKDGALVPEQDETDRAAEFFGFDSAEAKAHRRLKAAMENNPGLQKQVIKRIRRHQRGLRMAPSLKTRRS